MMSLQELFRDFRMLYWPVEAYVHARAVHAKRHLVNGTWSFGVTAQLADPGTFKEMPLPR